MGKNKILFILFFYHLIFTVFSYQYALSHMGDSYYYWGKADHVTLPPWLSFAHNGTDFLVFLNYPFIKLGLPFFVGFLCYSIVGFFGIVRAIQWAEWVTHGALQYKGINFIYLVFMLPNLHFWTATLGKEPLIFYAIASIFYALATKKYLSFSFVIGSILIIVIRPHVALMFFMAVIVVFVFQRKFTLVRRIQIGIVGLILMVLLFYSTLQLAEINYFNWHRICYFNEFSILSFKHSGSYVPMLEYSFPHQLFVFLFQPLFFDAHTTLSLLASFENALVLIIHLVALFYLVKRFSKIHFQEGMKMAIAFAVISSILYIQRYANLGIFMRTKMQFLPFELIALFSIIQQGLALNNSED